MADLAQVTADTIIQFDDGNIVLIKRNKYPYEDFWAIPGGRIEANETVEEAAIREAKEETGLDIELQKIVGVYSTPNRDPRGRVITIAFLAKPIGGELIAATDAKEIMKTKTPLELELAFDHKKIFEDFFNQK